MTSSTIERLHVAPVPWWLRGGHLETVLPACLALPLPSFGGERRLVSVAPGTEVEAWWSRPLHPQSPGGSVLVVHGLGGSVERPHVRALTSEALGRGWHAVRVNLRTHGGTAALSDTLFSAVQSDDLGRVLEAMGEWGLPRPYVILAVSLGANMALRYAALAGDDSAADAVGALNPALDFFAVEREINRASNLVYRVNFVTGLCRMVEEVRRYRPVPGPRASLLNLHSVRDVDAAFTAPAAGFASVDDYYEAAGAGPLLGRLRVPAYVMSAANDPFVPASMVTPHHGAAEGRVRVAIADRGGHVGYRVRRAGGGDRLLGGCADAGLGGRAAGALAAGLRPEFSGVEPRPTLDADDHSEKHVPDDDQLPAPRLDAAKTRPEVSGPLEPDQSEAKFLAGPTDRGWELMRVFRIAWEFIRGFRTLHFEGPCVTVFGSARVHEDHPEYVTAREIGTRLAEAGFTVMTGGGPGAMEAANRGAREAGGRSIGANIYLPKQEMPNAYLDRFVVFRYFFVRKVMLVKYSYGFIVMPGGLGTLDEVFETATLIQTGKIREFPVVLVGSEFWGDMLAFLRERLVATGKIEEADLARLVVTDSPEEAVRIMVEAATGRFGLRYTSKRPRRRRRWLLE